MTRLAGKKCNNYLFWQPRERKALKKKKIADPQWTNKNHIPLFWGNGWDQMILPKHVVFFSRYQLRWELLTFFDHILHTKCRSKFWWGIMMSKVKCQFDSSTWNLYKNYGKLKTKMSAKKGTIWIGNTSSNHWFSGDMLVFGGVHVLCNVTWCHSNRQMV